LKGEALAASDTKALILTGIVVGLLAAAPLRAEDDDRPKWRFGLEGSFAMPVGNTHKAVSTRFGASIFLEQEAEKTQSCGISLDYVSLGEKKWEGRPITDPEIAASANNFNLQLYSRIKFNSDDSGFYSIGGIGGGYVAISDNSGNDSKSFAVTFTVGIGYSFGQNIGLIAKYGGTGLMWFKKVHNLDNKLLRGRRFEYLQFGAQYRF
jgi:hypothetical protein